MPKSLHADLRNHFAQQSTTIVTCWKAVLRNGTTYGFTNHDRDVWFLDPSTWAGTGGPEPLPGEELDTTVYKARAGFTRSDIASNTNLEVDNNDVAGMFDDESITEADLLAGLWDGAAIYIFEVNYADLSMGKSKLRYGRLGQVSKGRNQFNAELLGLSWVYTANTVTEITQPGCRATFGDQRCGYDVSTTAATGTVDSYDSSDLKVVDAARSEADDWFGTGKLTFTSGLNNGLTFEVRRYTVGNIYLQTIPPYEVATGDGYTVYRGCDKKFVTCIAYGNQLNFRGEPHLQGDDLLQRVGRRQ